MGNEITWPVNPHKYDRPQDFADERCEQGLFRCDRCSMLWPLNGLKHQDGFRLCQRCWDPLSPLEAQTLMAEERERNAQDGIKTLPYPVVSAFDGVSCVTAVSPLTLTLAKGGASGTVTLTGVNFSASDAVTASSGSITVSQSVDSSTQITVTVSASGVMTAGDYNLLFNSDTLTPRGILKVR